MDEGIEKAPETKEARDDFTSQKKSTKKKGLLIALVILIVVPFIVSLILYGVFSPKHYTIRASQIESIALYGYPYDHASSAAELKTVAKKDWKAFLKELNSLEITVQTPSTTDSTTFWLHIVFTNGDVWEIYPYLLVIFDFDAHGNVNKIINKYYKVDKKALYAIYKSYGLM